ncbi:MAG: LapA family protein [Desulfobacterales bacterium]
MNKTKLVIWLIILGFMGLVMYQNEGHFFSTVQSLRLNLGLAPEYRSPELPLLVYYLIFFVFGLLVAFVFALPEKMRKRRALKQLAAAATDRESEANALKTELARLKGEPLPGDPPESSITSPTQTR